MTKRKNSGCAVFFAVVLALSAGLRVLLTLLPDRSVSIYPDELIYLELAQNLFLRGTLTVYRTPLAFSKLLYPLLLSPFYAIPSPEARLTALSVFNALLISSVLIPGWLLARRLLKKPWQIRLFLLLLALSPNMGFSFPFMAEALYAPLLLWGFYFAVCWLQKPERRLLPPLLGFWSFLLFFTKESGLCFLAALLPLLLRPCVTRRSLRAAGPALAGLAGFVLPWLAAELICFGGPVFTYAAQVSAGSLATPGRVAFFLFAAAMMLFAFAAVWLFFPVALPVIRRRDLPETERGLLRLSCVYCVLLALATAFSVSVREDYPIGILRIHLRYLIGAAAPFLLLFLFLPEAEDRRLSLWGLLPCLAAAALFTTLPANGSSVDAPGYFALALLNSAGGLISEGWLLRVLACAVLLAGFLLLRRFGRRALLLFLAPLLCATLILNQFAVVRQLREEETVPDPRVAAQADLLEEATRGLEGNLLILWETENEATLRALNTRLSADPYLLTRQDVQRLAADAGSLPLSLADTAFPARLPGFARQASVLPGRIDAVLCAADADWLTPDACEDITPEGVTAFQLLRPAEPEMLALRDPLLRPLGQEITFGSADGETSFLRLASAGFLAPEESRAWVAGREAVVTLRPELSEPEPLVLRWSWDAVNTPESVPFPCEIYAGGELLAEEELSPEGGSLRLLIPETALDSAGRLTLRFVFPAADAEADLMEHRRAAAFLSLRLTSGVNCFFLPESLTEVPEGAFSGLDAATVYLPEGVTSLGARAFASCPRLTQVYVPFSLNTLADDAFASCPADLTLVGPANAPARWWAESHNIPYLPE